ncbi:succinylglutamate desuccinylase/aspartoacylase family protein [Microlunatus sp. Y2014]|uniref:succinylglutamate desuccinylase/aspartoacylase family protein n=1 Tax=Microlunatus sp. Y2014 TaxID=3418488 RepID=UPI003DA71907
MTSDHPTSWQPTRLGGVEPGGGVTRYRLDSGRPGPRLLVLGGVHGNEIGGIVGAGRVTLTDWPLVAGRLDVVPITHEAANLAFVRHGPADGRDLARTFPGDPHGEPTERLAALVRDELINDCDALIDLHTSAVDADLPDFAGSLHDHTPYGDNCRALALAFGLDTVWGHPDLPPGRTLSAAADRQIPAMYVESRRGGVLDATMLAHYRDGVVRVAERLRIVAPGTAPAASPLRRLLQGNGDTDTFTAAPTDGWFVAHVELLTAVRQGQTVGSVIDHRGATLAEVTAARAGTVVFLRRLAPVTTGTPLVSVCPEIPLPTPLESDPPPLSDPPLKGAAR